MWRGGRGAGGQGCSSVLLTTGIGHSSVRVGRVGTELRGALDSHGGANALGVCARGRSGVRLDLPVVSPGSPFGVGVVGVCILLPCLPLPVRGSPVRKRCRGSLGLSRNIWCRGVPRRPRPLWVAHRGGAARPLVRPIALSRGHPIWQTPSLAAVAGGGLPSASRQQNVGADNNGAWLKC